MRAWVEAVSLLGAVLAGISLYVGAANLFARWKTPLRWLGVHVFLLGTSYIVLVAGTLAHLRSSQVFDWRHVVYPAAYVVGLIGLWRLRKRRFSS